MNNFTQEEREYIDRLLEEVDQEQKLNGNKLIPAEEVFEKGFNNFRKLLKTIQK